MTRRVSKPIRDSTSAERGTLEGAVLGATELASFEALYFAHASAAERVAYSILRDRALAVDAVHAGFVEVLRLLLAGRRWYDSSAAKSVVLWNVRWAALKIDRARRRTPLATNAGSSQIVDDPAWVRAEARMLCQQIVAQLSPSHRTVLQLRFGDDLANVDAADHLGVSVDVFEARLHRAIKAAKRVAKGKGLLPLLLPLSRLPVRRWWKRARPRRVRLLGLIGPAVSCAGLVVGAGQAVIAWHSGASSVGSPAATELSSTHATGPFRISDTIITIAEALPDGRVLALGRQEACDCLLLFTSFDQGATWEPRLVSHQTGLPPANIEARSCAELPRADCPAVDDMPGTTVAAISAGSLLELPNGRFLYFRPDGGVLCSADGVSWVNRCSA